MKLGQQFTTFRLEAGRGVELSLLRFPSGRQILRGRQLFSRLALVRSGAEIGAVPIGALCGRTLRKCARPPARLQRPPQPPPPSGASRRQSQSQSQRQLIAGREPS